jgi:phage baseplate assembly protein W
MADIAFPYRVDARGRTAETTRTRHVRDLIEILLLTTPGERVMRPSFGANLLASVFAPTGAEEAAATRALIQSALQEHLRDVIEVQEVTVTAEESTLEAKVVYAILETGEDRVDTFTRALP